MVWTLAFISNGTRFIAATWRDNNITLWDIESSKVIKVLGSHSNTVLAVAVSPDVSEAVSAGGERQEIIRWDLKTYKKLSEWKSAGKVVSHAGFSKDRRAVGFGYKYKGSLQYVFYFDEPDVRKLQNEDGFIKERESGEGVKLIIKKIPDYSMRGCLPR